MCIRDSPYSGRQEVTHKLPIGHSIFETDLLIEGAPSKRTTIFQIHDGRNGCAPPLKVNIQKDGKIKLRGDYKKGPGEQCIYDIIKSTGRGKTTIKRDGTEYKLNVLLDFDGNGGFKVKVYINDEHEVSGEYKFKEGQGYIKSRYLATIY
mgnify:CR=1 FL=1